MRGTQAAINGFMSLMVIMTMVASGLTQAAPTAKSVRPIAVETYSAIEDDSDASAQYAPAPVSGVVSSQQPRATAPAPAPRKARSKAAPAPRTAALAPQAGIAAPVASAASSDGFDSVPGGQGDALLKRLKLVEILIARHGRAYDYRVMTVKELETKLAELDRGGVQSAPVQQAGVAAPSAPFEPAPVEAAPPAEKPLPEIPPPSYHDEGSVAPDVAPPAPPSSPMVD